MPADRTPQPRELHAPAAQLCACVSEDLRLLEGVVDIYLPDFKLWQPEQCQQYLTARDYAEAARAAIRAMHDQVGVLRVDEEGVALRGVLVRHLVMPGLLEDTRAILRWLATELSPDTAVNVMDQFRPAWRARTEPRFAAINRPLREAEFERALEDARRAGLSRINAVDVPAKHAKHAKQ